LIIAESNPNDCDTGHTEDRISVLDLLILFFERKLTIFSITAGFTLAAIVVSLLWPKSYTATVTLLPPDQSSSLETMMAAQMGGAIGSLASMAGSSLGLKNPNDMYVSLLRGQTVEDAMVQRYNLMQQYHQEYVSTARRVLNGRTTIDSGLKDGLIHISVEDGDPHRAAELANGFVEQFRNLSEHLAISAAGRRRLFFERQLQQSEEKMAAAEDALKEMQQKSGLIEINSQSRALIESAAGLQAQISAKEVEIQSIETFATGENAQLIQAKGELASLQTQLAKLGGKSADPDSLIIPKGAVSADNLEYLRKLRNVKFSEEVYMIIDRQYELAKLDEAKEGPLVQVVDPALPPDARSSPKRGLTVVVTTFFGFWFALFFVYGQYSWQRWKLDPRFASKISRLHAAMPWRRRGA
jgi:uncharacterized protein involved in exopolysaccharide biosynthesis